MSDHAITGNQSLASSTPQNSSPFQSLFLSLTRPLPQNTQSDPYTPYFVLFQHCQYLVQRLAAAEPDQSGSSQLYKHARLLTPKETSVKDARGDLFVKEAWRECVKRCSGRVIVVKCSDSVNFGYAQESRKNRKDKELDKLFGENGAVVDLHSDPLGWNSDCCSDVNADITPKQFKGIATKLQSILSVIQEAANFISSQTGLKDETATGENASIQPIPVIFDSISPLLLHHGVEKVTILFARLKQSTETFITSPIFIPTLSETLPPAGNRILEEYADAVLTLSGGKLLIAKRSARVGGMVCGGFSGGLRLTKDEQNFEISNDLVLLKKGSEPNMNNTRTKETKSEIEDVETGTKRLNLQDASARKDALSNENNSKQRPVLRHEDDASDRSATQELAPKPTPRIYLEEDDPEFDDLDEEDPDDDLDI